MEGFVEFAVTFALRLVKSKASGLLAAPAWGDRQPNSQLSHSPALSHNKVRGVGGGTPRESAGETPALYPAERASPALLYAHAQSGGRQISPGQAFRHLR